MSFPTIFDWLELFSPLRGYPATWILLGTGILIVLFLDWRLSLLALIVQYLIASLLFFDLLNPQLAIIKLFVGMFVCLILYWSARQVNYGRSSSSYPRTWSPRSATQLHLGSLSIPRTLAERIAAILVVLLVVGLMEWGFTVYLPGLPDDLGYINLAILLLISFGMAGLITGRDPLPSGMGVLSFLTGFELYFAALDQSTRTLAALAALNLVVALIISYLIQRRYVTVQAVMQNE